MGLFSGIANAFFQKEAARKQSREERKGLEKSIDFQRESLDRALETSQPFRQAGEDVIPEIMAMLGVGSGGPGSRLPGAEILQNPILKAIQDDHFQRAMNQSAAFGRIGSGDQRDDTFSALVNPALQFFGLEQDQRQQDIQNLMNLLLQGQSAAAGQGANIQQTGFSVGNNLAQIGAARGRGRAAGPLAASGLISDLQNQASQAAGFFSGVG